jgi:hypothetical protein
MQAWIATMNGGFEWRNRKEAIEQIIDAVIANAAGSGSPASDSNGDRDLPGEKLITIRLTPAMYALCRQLLDRGIYGRTLEDVERMICDRLLMFVESKRR